METVGAFLSATDDAVGRLHGEVDGAAVWSTVDVSRPVC